jgi:branched-chain amino acid transport system substrate-binding protein
MNAKGAKEVFRGVNKDDKDFSALVSKVKASGADLIYWGGLHDTGGLILRQMRAQGVKAPLMGGDGITDDEFAVIAGPGAEGTLMTFSPDPRNPANKEIVESSARSLSPGLHALLYAAVQIIKQAAEAAKSLDPKVAKRSSPDEVQDRDRRLVLRQERRCDAPRLRGLCLEEGSQRQDHL